MTEPDPGERRDHDDRDNLPIELTDTHCHLDFNAFDPDRAEVIERARRAGVLRMLIPGIDLSSSQNGLQLAELYPEIYAAVGIHPNDSLTWKEDTRQMLYNLAAHPKVVAIGEIGLDYYRDRAPKDWQSRVFQEQLALAAEVELPVIIHSRDSMREMLTVLSGWVEELRSSGSSLIHHPGVLHSFSGTEVEAQQAIDMNFSIGITGPVTFPKAMQLQSVVSTLPLDRLLLETDAPFLTPQPYRGRRNEPAYVLQVAQKIADLRGQPLEKVTAQATANADRLFMWRESV